MEQILLGAGAAGLTQAMVNAVKFAFPRMKTWHILLTALIMGIVASFLFSLSSEVTFNSAKAFSDTVISGITSALGAIGLTQLHTKTQERRLEVSIADDLKENCPPTDEVCEDDADESAEEIVQRL